MEIITSPDFKPAFFAGEPSAAEITITPSDNTFIPKGSPLGITYRLLRSYIAAHFSEYSPKNPTLIFKGNAAHNNVYIIESAAAHFTVLYRKLFIIIPNAFQFDLPFRDKYIFCFQSPNII